MAGKTDPRLLRAAAQKLESLRRAGVTDLPRNRAVQPSDACSSTSPAPLVAPKISSGGESSKPSPPTGAPASPDCRPADASRAAQLERLACQVATCTRCPVLVQNRSKTVFGVGNPHARLVFLGEAPGADEDRQGIPFVGRAGQLLTDMIEKGMKLRREDVYILNILRCRPPDNRTPLPEEAANCREYLDGQLAIIRPEFICCLGACAAQNLLGTTTSIGQLRGRFHDHEGVKVLCTYHPAYLLRNPGAKASVWDDLKKLMAEMGLPVPGKP